MPIEHEYSRVIHHGGRSFFATSTMADIFIAHARDTAERGDTELVPLLHKGGVELLLVGPLTRIAMSEIEVGTALDEVPPPKSPRRLPAPASAGSSSSSARRHRVAG
ncbi:hypothetical protein N1027_15890 [Herbiconiux sp. CPCC 205763]|uniref:Uncharacterized protein n=1 Tax=Herbiconiux aconitum TaxID=2970913 RepID=A0ABT2GXE2_9MICO|nr:hypothetical protein [Herbiconiux aconitum]MCS5719614.1 hypothetical protein [Herbiconiux aconitum]